MRDRYREGDMDAISQEHRQQSEARRAWETASRSMPQIRRLFAIANTLAQTAEPGSAEWRDWRAAASGLEALVRLHGLGCPMAPGDPEVSPLAVPVLLDQIPGHGV